MIALYIVLGLVIIVVALIMRQVRIYNKAGSIYYKNGIKEELHNIYDDMLKNFPVRYSTRYIDTAYGKVHVLECGKSDGESLVLFHAASVGSVSWKDNVEALGKKYHLYLIDTLGEGNKSELYDVEHYPKTSKEVANLYKDVFTKLGIYSAHITGASYGGFICLNIAAHYPETIDKMILIGAMGIAPSVPKVIARLTLYLFFPLKALRKKMTNWSFGDGDNLESSKDYFSIVLKGVLGRYYAPLTVKKDILKKIKNDTLILLGSKDNLVGNPIGAIEHTSCMKNVIHKELNSGHLINVEKYARTNEEIINFLN